MKILPIIFDDAPVERAALKAWCYLLFSGSESDAVRAFDCLQSEHLAIQAGRQERLGEVGGAVNKLLERRLPLARLAGLVLYQVILNVEERGAVDFRKAVFSVSRFATAAKTKSGKALPADEGRLRREFKVHLPALCYWSAFELLPHELQQNVQDSDDAFRLWMITAGTIEKKAADLGLFEIEADPLVNWEPWHVPMYYHAAGAVMGGQIVLPKEPIQIKERLAEYRWEDYKN